MRLRHRQPAQTFVMAALGMVSMIGALSMVVDAGVYFVIQRQLQNAADAAALAAVWFGPPCETVDPGYAAGCHPGNPDTVAADYVRANWSIALSLCQGPTNLPSGIVLPTIDAHAGTPLKIPAVSTYVVSLKCKAPHWFGRIFPNISPTMDIVSSAAATVGWRGPNGQVLGTPGVPPRLIARLIV